MVGGHKTYHFPVPAAPADPLSPAGATLGPYGVKAYANLADLNFPAVPTGLTWALYHDNASSGAVPFIYAPELTYIYTALASKLEWKWTLLSFSQVMVTWTWVPGDAGGYWAVSNITPVVPAPDWGQLTITQMVELTDAVNLLDAAESIGRANFELIPLGTKRLLGPDILPYTLRTSYHDANELWQAFTPPNQYEWMIGYPYRFQGAFGAVLSLLMNHVRTENRNGVVTKQSFTVPECQKRIQVISPEPGLTVSITKG